MLLLRRCLRKNTGPLKAMNGVNGGFRLFIHQPQAPEAAVRASERIKTKTRRAAADNKPRLIRAVSYDARLFAHSTVKNVGAPRLSVPGSSALIASRESCICHAAAAAASIRGSRESDLNASRRRFSGFFSSSPARNGITSPRFLRFSFFPDVTIDAGGFVAKWQREQGGMNGPHVGTTDRSRSSLCFLHLSICIYLQYRMDDVDGSSWVGVINVKVRDVLRNFAVGL